MPETLEFWLTLWSRPCQSRCRPSPSCRAEAPGCHREEESSTYGSPRSCWTGCSWARLSSTPPSLCALEARGEAWIRGENRVKKVSLQKHHRWGRADAAPHIYMSAMERVSLPKGCFAFVRTGCGTAQFYLHSSQRRLWTWATMKAGIHVRKRGDWNPEAAPVWLYRTGALHIHCTTSCCMRCRERLCHSRHETHNKASPNVLNSSLRRCLKWDETRALIMILFSSDAHLPNNRRYASSCHAQQTRNAQKICFHF